MSYPPPPGLSASHSTTPGSTPTHSSLPPRPLPPAAPLPSFKPSSTTGAPGTGGYRGSASTTSAVLGAGHGGFTTFKPRQVAGAHHGWSVSNATVSAPPAPPTGFSTPSAYGTVSVGDAPSNHLAPAQDFGGFTTPQIRNPFPLPGHEPAFGGRGGGRYNDPGLDPETEAQIAQWQSAYAGKDHDHQGGGRGGGRSNFRMGGSSMEGAGSASGANAGPLGGRGEGNGTTMTSAAVASAADADSSVAAVVSGPDGKQKTVVRSGGGQSWHDTSLLEWDPAHFRLFVGNLAGEVTDESLLKAFSKYSSVQKARVVRDKRTAKSKGYGFVSFSNGDEYFQAARDMQGKYIGSHPILLRRSTTEIRPVVPDKKGGKYGKGGKGGGRDAGGGAKTGAGVHKKLGKTKGGLRVLG
ncbi:MAG: hypothetical protein M1838_001374 [Thelocarpon superellum]|nr:MAG: hypothetical protein M1838_001374 [Thelocarpon superellum]